MSDQYEQNSNSNTPDDTAIEALLGQFSPKPSAEFYLHMQKTPWGREILRKKDRRNYHLFSTSRQVIGFSMILLLLILIGASFIPSVQVIARQIFFSFLPAPSNKIEVQVSISNPADLFNFSDPGNFPYTIEEIRQNTNFSVKEILHLPDNLSLTGSRYDADYNTVTILYQGKDYSLFVMQRPMGKGKDVFSIGSTASVNLVKVGNQQGEFVRGGWKAISSQTSPDVTTPGYQTKINAIWDNDLPQYTLRWKDEYFVYEIRSIGKGSPPQAELISIANELK